MREALVCAVACFLLTGCNGLSTPQGKISSASYVGDQRSLFLDEVVVSALVAGQTDRYNNLHIFFSAVINSERPSLHQGEVADIVRRSSVRLSSAITEELCNSYSAGLAPMHTVRSRLLAKAQQTFDSFFSRWEYAGEFKVEIVIVSIYLTDSSVGKATSSNRLWWD